MQRPRGSLGVDDRVLREGGDVPGCGSNSGQGPCTGPHMEVAWATLSLPALAFTPHWVLPRTYYVLGLLSVLVWVHAPHTAGLLGLCSF